MFCKKCGSILKAKLINGKNVMACSCGYVQEQNVSIKLSTPKKFAEVEIIHNEEEQAFPKCEETCPKCENNEAYYWTQQTGPSDEPEVYIYRCTKCKHTWRSTIMRY